MDLLEKELYIRRSKLKGAGLGLFTKKFIPKGSRIIEYKGRISNWRELEEKEWNNGYIFYVNRNHVINARPYRKSLARYANDAKGLKRRSGLTNNAQYVTSGLKVFIETTKDIERGSEILVGYGREYWDAVKHNSSL